MVSQCIGRASGGQADTTSLACRRAAWNNLCPGDEPTNYHRQRPTRDPI